MNEVEALRSVPQDTTEKNKKPVSDWRKASCFSNKNNLLKLFFHLLVFKFQSETGFY